MITFDEPLPKFIPTKNHHNVMCWAHQVHTRPDFSSRLYFEAMNGVISANMHLHMDIFPQCTRVFSGYWTPSVDSKKELLALFHEHYGLVPFEDATYEQKVAILCTPEHPEWQRLFSTK